MQIEFHGRDHNCNIEVDAGITIRQALETANILPSTVVVSFMIEFFHIVQLQADVKLLVTTVSSGG